MADRAGKDRPVIGIIADREGHYVTVSYDYLSAVVRAGGLPVVSAAGSDPEALIRVIDALLIPGGDDLDPSLYSEEPRPGTKIVGRERTDFEIALVKAIMKLRKPVFGICYGMQLMNVALGGSLYQDIRAEFGGTVDHTAGSHRVRGKGELMQGEFLVNSTHHQAVKELAHSLEAGAVSDEGLIEAIVLPGHPFFAGVQWHPERSDDGLSRSLFRSLVVAARECK
ncbi:MAG: gamma-glutamyl-gamma-aminobutyrate hydrolase family protein [Nitrospirae bacterium]|nr:gamma-glutamyl-gamma-aminobutyrate hydrolase family protein [Nitrospirota bacterium]